MFFQPAGKIDMEEQERIGQEKSSRQPELHNGTLQQPPPHPTPTPTLPKKRLCWLGILVVALIWDGGQAPAEEPS